MRDNIPNIEGLQKYKVNRAGAAEVVRGALYDYLTYPTTGQTQFTFYQNPKGSSGKTYASTNMEAAGQLPAPKLFLIQHIEVFTDPGTAQAEGGLAAGAINPRVNEMNDILNAGWLELYIGSKTYLIDAPLRVFPMVANVEGYAARSDSSTAGGTGTGQIADAYAKGAPYRVVPILLESNQNFNVTLNFDSLVTVSVAGRIGIRLVGLHYRLSQ